MKINGKWSLFAMSFLALAGTAASAQDNSIQPTTAADPLAGNLTVADPLATNVATTDPLAVDVNAAEGAVSDPSAENLSVGGAGTGDDLETGALADGNMADTEYVQTRREDDGTPWDLLGLLGLAGLLGLRRGDKGDIHVDARHNDGR